MNYRDDIKAYLDGELTADRMEEMRRALEADPSLKAEADEFSMITGRIQDMAKVPPVEGLERAIARMGSRPAWVSRNWTWAAPALAFVAIAAGMTALNGGPEQSIVGMDVASKASGISTEKFRDTGMEGRYGAAATPPEEEAAKKGKVQDGADMWWGSGGKQLSPGSTGGSTGGGPGGGPAGGGAFANSREKEAAPIGGVDSVNGSVKLANPQRDETFAESSAPILEYDDRSVIREAEIKVEVEDARRAKDELVSAVEEAEGFVESSDLRADKEYAVANVRARVPVAKFKSVIEKAKGLGFVVGENQTGEDVTLRIVDADSRIKTYRNQEEQFRLMLGKAKTTGEIIEIKDRLGVVRANIESLQAQRAKLKKLSDLSTLNATLEQKNGAEKENPNWADDSWTGAVGRFDTVWRVVATFLMNLLTLAPFWLPVALFVWWYRAKGPRAAV